jgi:hypothetical protein
MTRHAPLWQQALSYPAGTDRYLMGALWPAGGATGGVTTAVANTMTVSVAPGFAAAPLTDGGSALCHWDAPEIVTIAAAPPAGQSRDDLVIVQVRDPDLDGGANNDFIVSVVTGTPVTLDRTKPADAGQPLALPPIPPNAVALTHVVVPGGAANLNTATITDVRRAPTALPALVTGTAWATGGTAIMGGTFNPVTLGASANLTGGMVFQPSGLKVPVAGLYRVNGQVKFKPGGSGAYTGALGVNGTAAKFGNAFTAGSPPYPTCLAVANIRANAGDVFNLGYTVGSQTQLQIDAPPGASNYLDVQLIG